MNINERDHKRYLRVAPCPPLLLSPRLQWPVRRSSSPRPHQTWCKKTEALNKNMGFQERKSPSVNVEDINIINSNLETSGNITSRNSKLLLTYIPGLCFSISKALALHLTSILTWDLVGNPYQFFACAGDAAPNTETHGPASCLLGHRINLVLGQQSE